jgi:hypothetical protein
MRKATLKVAFLFDLLGARASMSALRLGIFYYYQGRGFMAEQ